MKFKHKYKSKQIELEAYQFTDESKNQIYSWATSIQGNIQHGFDENNQPIIKIPTQNNPPLTCKLGDYIIVNPFSNSWHKLLCCKKSIFEQNYKLVL